MHLIVGRDNILKLSGSSLEYQVLVLYLLTKANCRLEAQLDLRVAAIDRVCHSDHPAPPLPPTGQLCFGYLAMTEHQNIAQRIRFDAEDRLPPAYWDRLRKLTPSSSSNGEIQHAPENGSSKRPNIDDWVNAPEFIPRHKQSLANSFGFLNPMATSQHESGFMFPDATNYPYPDPHTLMETSYDSGVSYSLPPSTTPESVTMQSAIAPPFNLQPILNQRPLLPPIGNLNLSMNNDQTFSFVPKGYSANLTAINSGIGPPIAAIVLKKKRKRRPRRGKTAMEVMNTRSEGTYESLRDLQGFQSTPTSEGKDTTMTVLPGRGSTKSNGHIRSMTSEPDLASLISAEGSPSSQTGHKNLADSCPDLSATQLELWDNILYKAVMTDTAKQPKYRQKARKELFDPRTSSSEIGATSDKSINDRSKGHSDSPVMHTSIYELCPFSLYDEDGNNEPFNPSEEQEFIKLMTTSQTQSSAPTEAAFSSDGSVLVSRPSETASKSIEDSYQIIKKSAAELENLKVKPSNHDNQHFHLTRAPNSQQAVKYDPKTNKYHTALYDDKYEFDPQVEEDYFEGMHIRVNAFEANNDLTLSESELPQPSRFQQMQWALQRQKEKYVPIEPPERVCCSLM
uniref:PHD-type domain-containing protein n=1 Tax=Panagrellus redivivus TaxID=6233 RepID=A0A7E4ZXS6_PANRE